VPRPLSWLHIEAIDVYMIALLHRLRRRFQATRPAPMPPNREEWTASDWSRVRAPTRHRDQALSLRAQRWLARLPEDSRPRQLAQQYPRIVNQLAACWRDHGVTEHLLDQLLTDTRGGRVGFAPAIVAELEMVYLLHDQRVNAPTVPSEAWSAPTQT
jgi:hypothetical protein